MACKSCRKKVGAGLPDNVRIKSLKAEELVDVEFLGFSANEIAYKGPSGTKYRFSMTKAFHKVMRVDAEYFAKQAIFRVSL